MREREQIDYRVGILVHGDNHFIVRGPMPERSTALELVRHWSLIQIKSAPGSQRGQTGNATDKKDGNSPPSHLSQWRISTKEFRENLKWAVVVPGDREPSAEVRVLLDELTARGIILHDTRLDSW